MNKLLVLVGALLLTTVSTTSIVAAKGKVVGSYTISDLGQGVSGGGSLIADGSVTGRIAGAFNDGQEIGLIEPTGWTSIVGSNAILFCFDASFIKSETGQQDFSSCIVLPVAGTPELTDLDGDGNPDLVMRVTLS